MATERMATERRPSIDKVIVSVLLIIAGVVASIAVVNAVYPAVTQGSSSLTSATNRVSDRVETQVTIIQSTGELNSVGTWVDANSDGDFDIYFWVKNVGTTRIMNISESDVYVGPVGNWRRIPYVDYASGAKPNWTYSIENGTEWWTADTIKVTIHYSSTQSAGTYWGKFVAPNGVFYELNFSF